MMIAAGIALAVTAVGTTWRWAGLIAGALLVGTSSQLALTVPLWTPEVRIQPDRAFHLVLGLAIAGQLILSLIYLYARAGGLGGAARWVGSLGVVRAGLFVVLLLGFSVTAMTFIGEHDPAGYLRQLAIVTVFLLVNFLSVYALAASLPAGGLAVAAGFFADRISFPEAPARTRPLDRHLPRIVALWVLALSAGLCVVAFQRIPHLGDELAYILQARYFAQGRISIDIPSLALVPAFDYLNFTVGEGKWFSSFPPGWPLILALGAVIHLEWLVNPLLAAASILLAHALLRREADPGTANVVVLLLGVSPWYLAMSGSLMSHNATLALWLGACLILSTARTRQSPFLGLAAGLLMGLLFLARPMDGLVMGTLTGLWSLRYLRERLGWTTIMGYGIGCIVIGVLIFAYNAYLTGDPFLTPIDRFFADRWGSVRSQLGFGSHVGPPAPWKGVDLYQGHSPLEAAIFAQHDITMLNTELFGWSIGSLSVVFFHTLWGRWSRRDFYMLAIIVGTVAAYGCYWFSGGFYIGPRYWFMTALPLVMITASGIGTLARKLPSGGTAAAAAPVQRLVVVLATLSTVALISFLTWRCTTRYFEFREFHTDYRDMLASRDLDAALIFVRDATAAEIGSASFYNPLPLDRPEPIFVRDLGPESNRAVAEAFPGRPIYFAVGRQGPGDKAKIVAGPIASDALP